MCSKNKEISELKQNIEEKIAALEKNINEKIDHLNKNVIICRTDALKSGIENKIDTMQNRIISEVNSLQSIIQSRCKPTEIILSIAFLVGVIGFVVILAFYYYNKSQQYLIKTDVKYELNLEQKFHTKDPK
ncbi:hypothetical protein AGMMS49938_02600 [Fibrobacterales bacterium]|nr:hypothetical protein AGMMS49938_02600 [Fibrobacterales bacterium]